MPFADPDDVGGFVSYVSPQEEKTVPTTGETFGSAFRLENDVLAAYEMVTKPVFQPDPLFNVTKRLKDYDVANRTNLWDNYRENFLGVRSDDEFRYIAGKISQEQKDKEVLENSGWTGTIAAITAGTLSPTMILPFVGEARGLQAVGRGALAGAAGGALQELPLYLSQETRTPAESAFSIAAGTVLGGVLGGAVAALRPGEREAIEAQLVKDAGMVRSTIDAPIPASAGAAAVGVEYAGRLKAARAAKLSDWLGPVTRVINQESNQTASWFMSQLADAGLRLEGNTKGLNTSEGGTVESLIKPYYGQFAQVTESIDQNYAKYIFGDGNIPGLAPNQRAAMAGFWDNNKLSKTEFRAEVSRALREGDEHIIPEVAALAKDVRRLIFDPMLKEAQRTGVLGEVKDVSDPSYFHRMYKHEVLAARQNDFVEILSKEYSSKLNAEFGEQLAALTERERRDTQLVEDLVRPKEEVEGIRADLAAQAKALEEDRNPATVHIEEQIADLRSLSRLAKRAGETEKNLDFNRQIRELETSGGEDLATLRAKRSEIKRRQQGLSRAAVALEDRQLKKLSAIERIEDLNTRQLDQVARAGQRVLNKLDRVSDKELDRALKDLGDDFAELEAKLSRSEDSVARLLEGEQPDTVRLLAHEERQQSLTGRMSAIASQMETLDTIDRNAVRASIQEALQEVQSRAMNAIEKRLARENKLIEAAAALDPAEAARRVAGISHMTKQRRLDFMERVRERGADNIDLDSRSADFSAYARDRAVEVKDKILSTTARLPLNDVLTGARGPELARVLDIKSSLIDEFLDNDLEHVLRSYIRTMAPDIEMNRKFGSVNGEPVFAKMLDEYNAKVTAAKGDAKAIAKLSDDFRANKRDLEAVIGRLRGTWGLPDNPDGMAYRMGRAVLNLNVLRLMGGTLIASIPDAARPIQRYGLTRTFRDGFLPMISNWKQLQIGAREAKYAGAALDAIMHTRAQGLNDVLDDYGRHSKFERGLEYASNKMGAIALFDYWTVAMKQLSSSVIIGKISDSLDIIHGGSKASAKEVREAQEFLASKGLAGPMGERVYKQMLTPEGGNRINDVLMPNTESWTDTDAQRAFRGALASEVNNTIITPGVERPLWMDSSMTGRILGQFKSFGMSSTFKVLQAGLQQRDMAFVNGTIVSLALGALSYYLNAVAAGGDTYKKMQKAGIGKFADEAINRSGVLGIYSDAQRFFERIPATQPYVSFSGDRTTRRGGDDIVDVLGGPSLGAIKTAGKVATGLNDPTKSTLHSIRQLMPWQNLIGLRLALDKIEETSNLPERRN